MRPPSNRPRGQSARSPPESGRFGEEAWRAYRVMLTDMISVLPPPSSPPTPIATIETPTRRAVQPGCLHEQTYRLCVCVCVCRKTGLWPTFTKGLRTSLMTFRAESFVTFYFFP